MLNHAKLLAKRGIYMLMRSINGLIPKRSQLIFISIPDFSDNPRALYEYISGRNFKNHRLVWLIESKSLTKKLIEKDINAYDIKSLSGVFQFFRSKYILTSHNNFGGLKASNQYFINLLHGMGTKGVGFMDNSEKNLSEIKRGSNAVDMMIASSPLAKSLCASCFFMDPRKILITGLPRNDKIFSNQSKANLSTLLARDTSKFSKIVLFAPTFRTGMGRIDSSVKFHNVFNFEDYDPDRFNAFLKDNNILFVIKLHPLEETNILDHCCSDNIINITNEMIQKSLIGLYDILGAMDTLITDYSTIYFDFLLLNRPIIFIPYDVEEYSKTRGFLVEPYESWTPGPKIYKFEDLLTELKGFIEDSTRYNQERIYINKIMNRYNDNLNCERVFNELIKLH
jgi:CDP-glycerol glycerophosphotransferase